MEDLITFGVALLSITNPVGNMAIFSGMTAYKNEADVRSIAFKAGIAILIIMLAVIWSGDYILEFFGITLPSFEAAGGLIVGMMGLSMLQSKTSSISHSKSDEEEAEQKDSIAIVPVAIPLIAGPGTIATILVWLPKFPSPQERLVLSLVCAGTTILIWLFLHFSNYLSGRLGIIGINVVIRLMGIILTALAFGMLAKGLTGLFPILQHH
ncbi:UPF0056 inner membrane protein (plasmid) [Fulvitalea axinellae]|uniref:UPF0056 membrane protein n=1 Tax=Fulvitalea axinellae TaxID=1182444 RepID=A0AAU9CLC8_9BACT|nr:UPF0056 inner membrane protein [Fulvitalea axinellae]